MFIISQKVQNNLNKKSFASDYCSFSKDQKRKISRRQSGFIPREKRNQNWFETNLNAKRSLTSLNGSQKLEIILFIFILTQFN